MVKTNSKPVSEKELVEESDIESIELKDGAGYGDLQSLNAQPDETNTDSETYVGLPAQDTPEIVNRSETYIQERKSYSMGMTDQNKLKNTKLGDHINYYENGVAGNGIVTKMSGQFIQIHKDDGKFYNININDTFHVSDILINKTWDGMSLEERTDALMKIKAYSPRFLSKTWDQLPRELKDVMKLNSPLRRARNAFRGNKAPDKTTDPSIEARSEPASQTDDGKLGSLPLSEPDSEGETRENVDYQGKKIPYGAPSKHKLAITELDHGTSDMHTDNYKRVNQSSIEDGALGNTGNSPTTGVSTKIPFDAPKDYEGQSHANKNPDREFQYEDNEPEVGKEEPAPEVKLDEQGLVKGSDPVIDMVAPDKKVRPRNQDGRLDKAGAFVYSDNPNVYKLPPQAKQKGYGMRYGVKYINEEEDN
jgi:hypothetical protein